MIMQLTTYNSTAILSLFPTEQGGRKKSYLIIRGLPLHSTR